jgi:hypothetical protein
LIKIQHKAISNHTEYAPVEGGITAKCTIQLLLLTVNTNSFCVISGFRREVAENCALLGLYSAYGGKLRYSLRNNPYERSSQLHFYE